jgi:hypothetical protein
MLAFISKLIITLTIRSGFQKPLGCATRTEAPLSIGAYLHVNLRAHPKIDTCVRYLTPS